MNARLRLTLFLSLTIFMGCPASPEDEDVTEIPPKENNDTADAGNDEITNTVVDAGNDETTNTVVDAGNNETTNTVVDAGNNETTNTVVDAGNDETTNTVVDAGNNTVIEITDAGEVDICTLPAEAGICLAAFQHYYFNSETGQCETFLYGGCGGNLNNFETLEACEAACGAAENSDAGNAVITEETDAGPLASSNWDFVSFGGCGDVYIHGRNAGDTVGLEFTDGMNMNLAEMAHTVGTDSSTTVFDLSVSPDTLTITEGANVTYESCNDAFDSNIIVERNRIWKPVSGTATITITPDGEPADWGEYPATAVLTLENVVMSPTDDDTVTVTLETITITTYVGWLPG